ncbi:hypothetical protein Hdeb2414_s0001g00013341 [Helianthus debilis subsp. tardiflorus]
MGLPLRRLQPCMAAANTQCTMGVAPSLTAAPTVYGSGGFRRCDGCYPVFAGGYDRLWRRRIVVVCGFVCVFIVTTAGGFVDTATGIVVGA